MELAVQQPRRENKILSLLQPRGADRLASVALALVLALLSASALLGAFFSYRSGTETKQATEISEAFEQGRFFVGAEESLERKYRLEPSSEVRELHKQAGASMLASLAHALSLGDKDDLPLIEDMFAKHKTYLLAVARMFAAIDAGDMALAGKIDSDETDPTFSALETQVDAAALSHRIDAALHLKNLADIQKTVLVATPIVFVVGIGLVVFFWSLLGLYRRKVEEGVTREAIAVRHSEQRFRSLVQNASDVVLICSPAGTITYQSPTAETAWGYTEGGLLAIALHDLVHVGDQPALRDLLMQLEIAPRTTRSAELRIRTAPGAWAQVNLILTNLLDEPAIAGFVATARDIAERKAFEEQLTNRAFYDSLTGLPNRALFRDRLDQALARGERRDGSVGLLFLDLDNFKQINDSLGHQMGDKLLAEAAVRLLACVRVENTVARLGGDEFVILLEHLTGSAEAVLVADRIAQQFSRPFQLENRECRTTVSIGIALAGAEREPADNILRNADVAMYRAKSDGKSRYVIFDASMQTNTLARLDLENDLRRAIERGELRVHYQPIVVLKSGQVIEVEALVRWQHPTRGLLAPGEFISIAEETGLIIQLGQWVLEAACRQVALWQVQFPAFPALMLSVNLSPLQFQQITLVSDIQRTLKETGLAPANLTLEITEGTIMRDVDTTIATLWQLKEMGIHLAIDDFGTGYSSLAYLKRLPLDVLKIDRSFVSGIGRDQEDTAITRAIISLAKSLRLSITGEGIETPEQVALLQDWACDRGQGYLFARPLNDEGLTELLRTSELATRAERRSTDELVAV
jgi:diguanylate cyclase (GGDEF)-like protein/PAS domain S-box-containing protein